MTPVINDKTQPFVITFSNQLIISSSINKSPFSSTYKAQRVHRLGTSVMLTSHEEAGVGATVCSVTNSAAIIFDYLKNKRVENRMKGVARADVLVATSAVIAQKRLHAQAGLRVVNLVGSRTRLEVMTWIKRQR
jgi:hypothetical protein